MVNFIKQLEEKDFVSLMVSLGQMKYGDNSRLYEYVDKEDRRVVHLYDNSSSFKDNGNYYIWVNDYETSNPNKNLQHNLFMLYQFGQTWYESAQKYFEGKKPENLDILNMAKAQYEKELEVDKEIMESLLDTDQTM